MKLNWKAGLIVFFVLFSFVLFMVSNTPSENVFYSTLLSLIAVVLSVTFVFSIYYADRRLAENKYTFWWIISYNLLVSAILYFIAVVSSIIIVTIEISQGAQSETGLLILATVLYGLWICPLSALIFSLIPSMIYKLLKKYQRILKIIKIIGIIIAVLFILFSLINFTTCNLYDDYLCLSKKAIEKDDLSVCEKSFLLTNPENQETHRDLCMKYAYLNGEFTNPCQEIKSDKTHNICIKDLAKKRDDPSLCDNVRLIVSEEWFHIKDKEGCLTYFNTEEKSVTSEN